MFPDALPDHPVRLHAASSNRKLVGRVPLVRNNRPQPDNNEKSDENNSEFITMDLADDGLTEQKVRTHGKPLTIVSYSSKLDALESLREI